MQTGGAYNGFPEPQYTRSNRNVWIAVIAAVLVVAAVAVVVALVVSNKSANPDGEKGDRSTDGSTGEGDDATTCTRKCLNGGSCKVDGGDMSCVCTSGYSGASCQNAAQPGTCTLKCLNGGSCKLTGEKMSCACTSGYSGATCQTATTQPGTCTLKCLNGGSCKLTGEEMSCACTSGYSGATCQTATTQPGTCTLRCQNGGTCKLADGVSTCACATGFSGATCQTSTTPAVCSLECQHGGSCKIMNGVSACECTSGYSGSTCQTKNGANVPGAENFKDVVGNVTFEMIFVKGGTYKRGCSDCPEVDRSYETPIHTVTVSDFHILKTEVTVSMFKAVLSTVPSSGKAPSGAANVPIIGVNWYDANAFVCALNKKTGRSYRLLTDAEWEFAARGGNTGVPNNYKYSGSDDPDKVAWHTGNSGGKVHDVATLAPNELGVYDMSGNSFEWVFDWLTAPYPTGPVTNPVQLSGMGNKCRRGGSYSEVTEFSRVSRRAIRSRLGGAGMGFRIGHSPNLFGMDDPCTAANPPVNDCEETSEYRDCRLINAEAEVWMGTSAQQMMIVQKNGLAVVGGYGGVSGEWYSLNERSFNIVNNNKTTTFAYYIFSAEELTMIGNDGLPYRLSRKAISEITGSPPKLPNIASPKTIDQLIATVEPERLMSNEQLANPDKTKRDLRLVPDAGNTWFMDGRCCGGNHKYRFHLNATGDCEFVVMDSDTTLRENILATGKWFTTAGIGLHIEYNGGYFNYLYTLGERKTSSSEYMPAGRIYNHISFQDYEKGDFRIFSTVPDTDAVHRPKMMANPVYKVGNYTIHS